MGVVKGVMVGVVKDVMVGAVKDIVVGVVKGVVDDIVVGVVGCMHILTCPNQYSVFASPWLVYTTRAT